MSYPIEVEDKIEHDVPELKFSYGQGMEIADKVRDYLRLSEAILVTGPGELSRKCIETWNNAGDWIYHLNDTTLFAEIRCAGLKNEGAIVKFATAGKNAKTILKDLQTILDEYQ